MAAAVGTRRPVLATRYAVGAVHRAGKLRNKPSDTVALLVSTVSPSSRMVLSITSRARQVLASTGAYCILTASSWQRTDKLPDAATPTGYKQKYVFFDGCREGA